VTKELARIDELILKPKGQKITSLTIESECKGYDGFNFVIDNIKIKYRKSKLTPKKVGQFVTLWKRNTENKTQPFHENDDFEFCIIVATEKNDFGLFLFSKSILCKNQIVTTALKEGKRGFRVYPNWAKTNNKQAIKTQSWQNSCFY